ncbi:extracellular solute-binding protein [Paenibacillus harenae]|uniref:Aldouronate transport system substrate-binding protein n=1 Tax=Paenibacillus harenae TaxID=306543 RepID=A0ABT9U3U8_PAEHA|nr:extracellular solute-binding protein [Paenibacillus harenae]MDQ0113711.1 putative aldouronate transport system substrate-binding protein [Paenibacillus harenae]
MKRLTKSRKSVVIILAALLVATVTLSACSKNESGNNGQPSPVTEGGQADSGPLSKYDPPIELSFVRESGGVESILEKLPNETIEDNRWTQLYEEELGIKIKYDWLVKGNDQYQQKLNVTLASGEIPDVIAVNAIQLKQLTESGLIEDLTEAYDKYATPLTKDILSSEGTGPFDAATFDGKLMGIPQVLSSVDSAHYLWIRTDWLEKLKLDPPKSMADVLAISKAFAQDDPDGNNKKDTFGLGITKDLWGGAMALEGFFAGYNAFPNMWTEDANGKLVYGGIQPEMKEALLALQSMLKDGQIDKEFGIKDGGKVSEQFAAGKIGIQYGEQWNSLWPLQANVDNDPNAQWQAFPLVDLAGGATKVPAKFSTFTFFAVKKGVKHPEAVVKLFNMHLERNWGETADFEKYYMPPEAEGVWKLSPVTPAPPLKNLNAFHDIQAAAGDNSKLKDEAKSIKAKLDEYASGTSEGRAMWGWERIYGPQGVYSVQDQYAKNNQFLMERFVGAPTETMIERKSTLDKLQNETIINIILGQPIEAFDKFVEDWKKLGGDAITTEVNDWYANKK